MQSGALKAGVGVFTIEYLVRNFVIKLYTYFLVANNALMYVKRLFILFSKLFDEEIFSYVFLLKKFALNKMLYTSGFHTF